MRHSPSLNLLKRALRVKVCAHCPRRPADSELWGSDAVRACEGRCPIFLHLPQIRTIAEQVDILLASRQRILRRLMSRIDELHRHRKGPDNRGRPGRRGGWIGGRSRPPITPGRSARVARVVDRLMGA